MNLKAKIGPLPAWAWGLILGGLAAVYLWARRASEGSDTSADTVTNATDDLSSAFNTEGVGSSQQPASDNTTGTTDTTTTTNTWWETQGVAYMSSRGTSPLTAQIALEHYLNGAQLTTAEQSIVNQVLSKLGQPPEGTASTPSVAPPTTTTTAPKPAPVTGPYETRITVVATQIAPKNAYADVTFNVAAVRHPTNNTYVDTGYVKVTRSGKTVRGSGNVNGGRQVVRIPKSMLSGSKGSIDRFTAYYVSPDPKKSWGNSSIEFSIVLK